MNDITFNGPQSIWQQLEPSVGDVLDTMYINARTIQLAACPWTAAILNLI